VVSGKSTPAAVAAVLAEYAGESPSFLLGCAEYAIDQAEQSVTDDAERSRYLERAVTCARAAVKRATEMAQTRGAA
jgi:hypothetical protein